MEVVKVSAEGLVGRLPLRPELLAPNGYLHAASVIALADTVAGYGTIANLPEGVRTFTTLELKSCALVLASSEGGKVTLIAGVSSDLTAKVKAGELVNFVAQQVGGKGGGRPDMAQAEIGRAHV